MSNRFEREFADMPWKLTRALAKHHWARAAEAETREFAWNFNWKAKRRAYLDEKRTQRKAKMEAEHGTAEERKSRFFSALEPSPVSRPSLALSLSVGG